MDKCVKCVAGTYNADTHSCTEEAFCEEGRVPYSGVCVQLGECTGGATDFSYAVAQQRTHEGERYNKRENYFKPYYANSQKQLVCKDNSDDVEPHSCEFSCQSGYKCGTLWGKPKCIKL